MQALPVYALLRASFLDFRPRLTNRCRVLPVYALQRASILDFKPKLANRCKVFSGNSPKAASILDFRGGEFGNHCSTIVAAVRNCPPAAPVAATTFRVRFYFSLPQRRIVSPAVVVAAKRSASESNLRSVKGEWIRLQQSLRQRSSASDSNLRCHEGEWFRLQQSSRQRSSASDSNFCCCKEEWFRLQWS